MAWDLDAAAYLRRDTCPRCEGGSVIDDRCSRCGAILRGEVADRIREISQEAAKLLDERAALLSRLDAVLPSPATPAPPARAAVPVPARANRDGSPLSLQSVLAVAGAGLLAVAVIVFRFFSLDVDLTARQGVTAGATLFFVLAAVVLRRGRLRFSAEAVGALALVFVGLDLAALAELATDITSAWAVAAVGTAVAAGLAMAGGALVRLRSWLWLGLVGLPLVPAFAGYAVGGAWGSPVGHLAASAVALGSAGLAARLETRMASPMRADRVAAGLLAALALTVTVAQAPFVDDPLGWRHALGAAALLAAGAGVAAVGSRVGVPRAWSTAAGVLAVAATATLPLALPVDIVGSWLVALLPAAGVLGVVLARLAAVPRSLDRASALAAAVLALVLLSVPGAVLALFSYSLVGLFGLPQGGEPVPLAVSAALLPLVAALLLLDSTRPAGAPRTWTRVAAWPASIAVSTLPWLVPGGDLARPAVILAIVVALGVTLAIGRGRALHPAVRAPLLLAAHLLLPIAALESARSADFTTLIGAGVAAAVVPLASAMPARARVVYVVGGYAYALGVLAQALDLAGVAPVPVVALTATVAALVATVVTLARRIAARHWLAVLAVTALPVLLSVQTVALERTWSTALASVALFALSLVVATTRRPGLTTAVRVGAAALILPAIATTVVNVVPRLLELDLIPAWNGGGGAPIVLPIVAALAALSLPAARLAADWVRGGDLPASTGRAVQIALEVSALVTGALATALALVLETTSLGTALVVLVILGAGSAAAALFARRRYGWLAAGAAWTGASWCAWGLAGVADLEVFVYPPALVATLVGVVLTLRAYPGRALVGGGLGVALATSLAVLAVSGSGGSNDGAVPTRALAVLGAGALLLALGAALGSRAGRAASLRAPLVAAAAVAALAGVVHGLRVASGADVVPGGTAAESAVVLAFAVAASALLVGAGLLARTGGRWRLVPALAALVIGPLATADSGVAPTWILWSLAVALLGLVVVIALVGARSTGRAGAVLPPALVVFAAAWGVAVAGWASRVLHVEWFSLPMGLALLVAGAIAWRAPAAGSTSPSWARVVAWPVGAHGSWRLLAPGVVVTLLPSILATGTNPATWRAILVIVLALAALLVGTLVRLAAPFVLSLAAFGVEIAVVFLSQLGRAIDPVVLWIALATAGAILLVIAVGFERRDTAATTGSATTESATGSARLRDLR